MRAEHAVRASASSRAGPVGRAPRRYECALHAALDRRASVQPLHVHNSVLRDRPVQSSGTTLRTMDCSRQKTPVVLHGMQLRRSRRGPLAQRASIVTTRKATAIASPESRARHWHIESRCAQTLRTHEACAEQGLGGALRTQTPPPSTPFFCAYEPIDARRRHPEAQKPPPVRIGPVARTFDDDSPSAAEA
ncbi:hypothetical protein EVG20_g7966 [Dentipellis fragilis]|uniref:Uncharacterized protein n=1 Tax=Dentipellis fragilis TaxID=205917 RepID=A0A4Y9Y8T6_9AGAM|nr:hypothetical protein EVG20_g7966 [Dentipellis fragilis]